MEVMQPPLISHSSSHSYQIDVQHEPIKALKDRDATGLKVLDLTKPPLTKLYVQLHIVIHA